MAKLNAFNRQKGWIEVICGPMFAGKSEELLRKMNRLKYAEVDYVIFKPVIDTRTKNTIKSRDGRELEAIQVKKSTDIIQHIKALKVKPQVIAIDEIQFFDKELPYVCEYLADNGFIIYAAGLDSDFRGEPFPNTANLLALAENVIKLTAICTECGAPATRTQKLIDGKPAPYDSPRIVVGNTETYTARCRHHHVVDQKKKINF
ncbi:MAG: thymidine kinase [Mycoplasmoidaceae bacterium]|nr:thymidine kinase [Mycoplasmoidaceae bacterium]